MLDSVVSSGGAISLPMQDEPNVITEPFKAMVKASVALACSASMFIPAVSSAAITQRAKEAFYSDYATISEVDGGMKLEFISEPTVIAEETATGLDLLFPDARSSNAYEQKIVADLIDDFFE